MKFFKKILGAAVVVALATSVVTSSASAHNPNNYKAPGGIFPALLGPVGVAAAVGSSATTATWTTSFTKKFFFHKYNFHAWKKVYHLKKAGFDLDIYKKHKWVKVKATKTKHHARAGKSRSSQGKAVVACVMGSALGAITASVRKATALGNPPRWRSQAEHERIVASGYEKQFELTSDESSTALALCGLGSFTLNW